ncbi:cysteine hydrolase [Clostridium butyricum]|uniref:cysteine hydrolase family protein n=1 Tax=Clostridium butyricum TaxID=1492 RepID=UPI000F5459E0|nr:cysteine hydrolase family protein [Clostridium butyricum]RQN09185.1 cysteine hydrolase [Clostridium butyricum]
MREVLILIDIQNMYFCEGDYKLYEPERAGKKAAEVLKKFRMENKPVIHVKHNFKVDSMENGEYLLDFNECVKPKKKEIIVSKNYPSAFLKTDLKKQLDKLKVDKLVIVGMMTHMCIDTTVRAAQNYGYKVTVIHDACTTKDLKWNGQTIDAQTVHDSIMASLQGTFGEVISCEEFME